MQQELSSSPDEHHHKGGKHSLDSVSSPTLKKKLGKTPKSGKAGDQPLERDLDTFNTIVRDYNKANMNANPRDFNAGLPILEALGAHGYD